MKVTKELHHGTPVWPKPTARRGFAVGVIHILHLHRRWCRVHVAPNSPNLASYSRIPLGIDSMSYLDKEEPPLDLFFDLIKG
jgi:hypothetical protein